MKEKGKSLDITLDFVFGTYELCRKAKDGLLYDKCGHAGLAAALVNYFYSRNFLGSVAVGLLLEAVSAAVRPGIKVWNKYRFNRNIDRMFKEMKQG